MTTNSNFDRAYDHICANRQNNSFYASLFDQFQRKGSLSEKQIEAVLRDLDKPRTTKVDKSEPANRVTECGMYRNEHGVFRVRLSEAGNLYAMRFVPEATKKSERFEYERGAIHTLTPEHRLTLSQAIELGAQHGVCCVCGLELTDPKSVERGIGPVCIKNI